MEFYLLYRFITLEHLNNNLISLFVNVKFTVYLHFVVFPVDSAVQKSVVKCFHVLSGTHTQTSNKFFVHLSKFYILEEL